MVVPMDIEWDIGYIERDFIIFLLKKNWILPI